MHQLLTEQDWATTAQVPVSETGNTRVRKKASEGLTRVARIHRNPVHVDISWPLRTTQLRRRPALLPAVVGGQRSARPVGAGDASLAKGAKRLAELCKTRTTGSGNSRSRSRLGPAGRRTARTARCSAVL